MYLCYLVWAGFLGWPVSLGYDLSLKATHNYHISPIMLHDLE